MGYITDAMQRKYIKINNLKVSNVLLNFVNNELLKDTEVTPDNFWKGFDQAVHELAPKNKELLDIRNKYCFQFEVMQIHLNFL